MQPVLDDLALGHALEVQPRPRARGVVGRRRALLVVVLRPVTQRLGPEAGDADGLRAVEGDLELLDRWHGPEPYWRVLLAATHFRSPRARPTADAARAAAHVPPAVCPRQDSNLRCTV